MTGLQLDDVLDSSGCFFDAGKVPCASEDPLYSLVAAFESDTSNDKVDLGVGAYRDDHARPWILPAVQQAKEIRCVNGSINHEYLAIAGLASFVNAAKELILGSDSPAILEKRVSSIQSLSGTGAVHTGGALLSKFSPGPGPLVYISDPTWPIHSQVFEDVNLRVLHYPYFSSECKILDIEGMLSCLKSAPSKSVVVLHACAHNPTGVDPTEDQWRAIAEVMRQKDHLPFFDCAYQGFASGSLSADNFSIRLFVEKGFQVLIAQSFAKNMGLYGERVGAFHYVAAPGADAMNHVKCISSQLSIIQRSQISSPPGYGVQIASIVLNTTSVFAQWETDLRTMSGRINEMRIRLKTELERLKTPGDWSHITSQIGMFSYTGLNPRQIAELRRQWHVYMTVTGRISVAGLNSHNVTYFARAIDDVVRRIE